MTERLFGIETEYAFTALDARGRRVDRSSALARYLEFLYAHEPNLPDKGAGGVFLRSGGRLYRDSGNHPELTTPEVINPWDICRYLRAGDRILGRHADRFLSANPDIAAILLHRSNVSYGGVATTWACHESYGHQASHQSLPIQLIPHLVSRIIYTGAGGFDNRSPGAKFMVSPRVSHLTEVTSGESQSNRGIYHTKDEPLSNNGHGRLHILCGESNCSDIANWLKTATTALVVAMIEAGVDVGLSVQLREPLLAMRTFAEDAICRAAVPALDGRPLTAIAVQRHYLRRARQCANAEFMPTWTTEACDRWQAVLDRLEGGSSSVAKVLDWGIKRALFEQFLTSQGFCWEQIEIWTGALEELGDALIQGRQIRRSMLTNPKQFSAKFLSELSPVGDEYAMLSRVLERFELSWDGLESFLSVRDRLFELDTRYSQVGPRGLFNSLDRAGVLDHHVPGVDNIEHAMEHPPADGRARLRGACVRSIAGTGRDVSCSWTGVWDSDRRRFLDLSDPFAHQLEWKSTPSYDSDFGLGPEYRRGYTLRHITRLYDRGEYGQAIRLLSGFLVEQHRLDSEQRERFDRLGTMLDARRGSDRAMARRSERTATSPSSFAEIVDMVLIHRFRGLKPAPEIDQWIESGLEFLEGATAGIDQATVAAFYDHHGWNLLCNGRFEHARSVFERVCRQDHPLHNPPRIRARSMASLGEVHRRLGNFEEAKRRLDEAEALQVVMGYRGDRADLTMTFRAKLDHDRDRSLALLQTAVETQRRQGNPLGEARSLLLQARIGGRSPQIPRHRERLDSLREHGPVLAACPVYLTLMDHWDDWVAGETIATCEQDFYCGI